MNTFPSQKTILEVNLSLLFTKVALDNVFLLIYLCLLNFFFGGQATDGLSLPCPICSIAVSNLICIFLPLMTPDARILIPVYAPLLVSAGYGTNTAIRYFMDTFRIRF